MEPVAADRPWLAALERAHALVGLQIELAVLAAAGLAVWRRELVVAGLGAAAVAGSGSWQR